MKGKTVVSTLSLLLVLLAGQIAVADTINFDTGPGGLAVADGTAINTLYPGVTFSCAGCSTSLGSGPDVYARDAYGFAESSPNVVSVFSSGLPVFDSRWGGVQATFATLQNSVSIDAMPVLSPEGLGAVTNEPWLQAFDASNSFLGVVYYPFSYGNSQWGTYQTLTITSASANIKYVQFSSQHASGAPVYGEFDNLTFTAGGGGGGTTVPEPCTLLLLGSGLAGVVGAARRQRRSA